MKKFVSLAVLLFGIVLGAFAQQTIKGDNLDPFTDIDLTGNLVVKLVAAEEPSVEIRLINSDVNRLVWNVSDGLLSIRLRPGAGGTGSAEVTIRYVALSRLKVSGANVAFETPYTGKMLEMDIQTGATLGGEFHAKDIWMRILGNSVADLTGETKYFTLSAGSRSKVNARELKAEDLNASASGGAEIYVQGIDRIQVSSDTGSSLFYRGEPEILRTSSKTMGTVNAIGK